MSQKMPFAADHAICLKEIFSKRAHRSANCTRADVSSGICSVKEFELSHLFSIPQEKAGREDAKRFWGAQILQCSEGRDCRGDGASQAILMKLPAPKTRQNLDKRSHRTWGKGIRLKKLRCTRILCKKGRTLPSVQSVLKFVQELDH